MTDSSIFMDKAVMPTDYDLAEKLETSYQLWIRIAELAITKYPKGFAEWNFPGKNYGWSFRIKDKKRAIIYLLPRAGCFKVAFVFGDKAVDKIMGSPVSNEIKSEISKAKKYVEGRGITIDINDESKLSDIEMLIDIKLGS